MSQRESATARMIAGSLGLVVVASARPIVCVYCCLCLFRFPFVNRASIADHKVLERLKTDDP
jgi:uncharacterized membrane protein YdfJ with MMPL/SSD domain